MNGIALTRARHLDSTVRFLDGAGIAPELLLEQVRLPAEAHRSPDALLPTTAVIHFRELVAARLGLPNISVGLMRGAEIADLGNFGRMLMRAPSLYRALTMFCAKLGAESSHVTATLEWRDGLLWVQHRNETPIVAGEWHSELYVCQWLLKTVQLASPSWRPARLRFTSPATPERMSVGEPLGCGRLEFGAPLTEFPVPAALLSAPVAPVERGTQQDRDEAISRLQANEPLHTVAGALAQVMAAGGWRRWWTLEEAAEAVGVPMRTLQRRLADEGTHYSTVLRDARLERAAALLRETDLELQDVAASVGFATHSNFSRAFRDWAGVTPGAFRHGEAASGHA